MFTCKDCLYHWRAEDEKYATCHYEGPDGWAPCEQEDKNDEDEDD